MPRAWSSSGPLRVTLSATRMPPGTRANRRQSHESRGMTRGTIERSSSLATLLRGMHPVDLFGRYAELLEHQKPVKHQVERDVLAIAEANHSNVVQPDGAAGWRDVANRAV